MQKKIIGMVLAGGRVDELSVLTAKRPKAALPVWGNYRIIDFVLTNMMRSGIEVVGVLAQYRPYSLSTHLGHGEAWDYLGHSRTLRVLSPYKGADDSDWYKGTADALYQNMSFVWRFAPRMVLIASGDHVYSMDYRPMIRQHIASNAELTIALKKVPMSEAHKFGTALLDGEGRVLEYTEKHPEPKSNLASLTVYIFNFDALAERLKENAVEGQTYQIYSEIIPRMVKEGRRVFGYVFEGYWSYARTIDHYYSTNMDIISGAVPNVEDWHLRTKVEYGIAGDPPPALYGKLADVKSSVISAGVMIKGRVERSVVSPGVTIGRGAVVRDSVIMHGCRIGEGAIVDKAILDKNVFIGRGAVIGTGEMSANMENSSTLMGGVTVIGRNTVVSNNFSIGRGCIIHPDINTSNFRNSMIPSGTTVKS